MKVKIIPYEERYFEQCAELEKYLWRNDIADMKKRFDWEYHQCTNYKKPISFIAVDEKDNVVGFRGYFMNTFIDGGYKIIVAQLADTVVSPVMRRKGLLMKMTESSIKYMKEEGIDLILNLSPSWPPYYAYKKLGFEDLSEFHSQYRVGLGALLSKLVFKTHRSCVDVNLHKIINNVDYYITSSISDDVLKQVNKLSKSEKIHSSCDFDNLKWRSKRPNESYIYAYSLKNGNLISYMVCKTVDMYDFHLGITETLDYKDLRRLFCYCKSQLRPSIMALWDFALNSNNLRKFYRRCGFFKVPFINKIRKNPPVLVYSLKENNDKSINWMINGKDIRDVKNWSINKFDLDSY